MSTLLKTRKAPRELFEFSMVVEGFDPSAGDFEDRLYKAGCDDALIGVVKGVVVLDFSRAAKSFRHALDSAMRDVRKAGGRAVRVEPDSYASLSDIAERAGLTRQAVSLLVQGKRGAGDFPPPAMRVTTDSPLWDWVTVATWLARHGKLKDKHAMERAQVTRRVNVMLEADRDKRAA
jgi:hypothetical protein